MAADDRQAVRPSFVVGLGLALIGVVVYWMWPAAAPGAPPSNSSAEIVARGTAGDPASLEVRLDRLKAPPPAPDSMARNPFRFEAKAAPPPPPSGEGPPVPGAVPGGRRGGAPQPPVPQGPPPIPLKFIGRLESPSAGVVALFSDGHGLRPRGHEGDIILGQYRIVHIGVESVVLEYLDGSGRQTIPLTGQGASAL
jgi:hypothetical protein